MNPTKIYGIALSLVLLWAHGGVQAQASVQAHSSGQAPSSVQAQSLVQAPPQAGVPVGARDTLYAKYGLHTICTIKTYDSLVARDPNQALVELDKFIPGIVLDIKYATSGNLMHRPVYKTAQAFLRLPAAEALKAVALELRPMGYGLKIYDGYRPYRVTVAFYEQYHDTNFVASPYTGSRHNRGCAVDLTLIDLKTGKELSMPTPFDSFDKTAAANYAGLPPDVLKNRALLQRVMLAHGFVILPSEWWHFDFAGWQHYPVTDIPFEELETSASAAGPSMP